MYAGGVGGIPGIRAALLVAGEGRRFAGRARRDGQRAVSCVDQPAQPESSRRVAMVQAVARKDAPRRLPGRRLRRMPSSTPTSSDKPARAHAGSGSLRELVQEQAAPGRTAVLGRRCCVAGAGLGALGFLGHLIGATWLTMMIPRQPTMMPNTALSLGLVSAAGALRHAECVSATRRVLHATAREYEDAMRGISRAPCGRGFRPPRALRASRRRWPCSWARTPRTSGPSTRPN